MAGPADTYLAQHPELFRNKGATTKNQRYDNVAQKKYGSKSTSVLPPEFTQEQLEQMYVQSRRNGTPWNGPVPNIALARQLEQVYGQDPNLARPLMQSVNANPISDNKQTQDARQPEPEKMGTKGPDTYNKAQGLIKDAQDKAGIVRGSEYTQAKRAQEDAARALDNAKGFEHIAKYTPNQDPAAVKSAEDEKDKAKDQVGTGTRVTPTEPDNKPEEKTEGQDNKPDEKAEEQKSQGNAPNTFDRDTKSMITGRPTGNLHDAQSATAAALGQDALNESANRQMEAQAAQQIANQNPYAEAGKQATVQNDAQNRQNVQKSGVLGSGAALARTTSNLDVASEKAREDTQRTTAAGQRERADIAQQYATAAFGDANRERMESRDTDYATDETARLANGENSSPWSQLPGQVAGLAKQGFNQAKDLWNRNKKPGVNYTTDPRYNDPAYAKLLEDKVEDIPSDERIKNIHEFCDHFGKVMSDMRMKWIKEDWNNNHECSQDDFNWLCSRAGNMSRDGREWGPDDESDDESVLSDYANHIRNYVYNYKPEAQEIDSSIDPNEEHIGPMAQDIEQVNPACVHETPEGVKTVDTQRLAMMNAGAIGDLARQLREMSKRLEQIGV